MSAKICNFKVPLTKYSTVKSLTFWKVSAKICNFRVPIYKGFPLPWMKRNPSLNDDCWPTILVWKDSLSEKLVLKYATLGFPFIRGFPSHEWNETNPLTMTASQVYECVKVSPSEKWVLKYTTYECVEVSLLQKWVLNYATVGFPFIRGFPSHEWNETLRSTMTAGQLYYREKVHFLKSEC